MLKSFARAAAVASALSVMLAGVAAEPALAAEKKPLKKAWEQLRDEPKDYSRFPLRRAENLKTGTPPLTQALAAGYATSTDIGTMPVITDPQAAKGLALEAAKLLPEKLGIKAPMPEFIIVDDIGFFANLRRDGKGIEAIDALLKKEEAEFTAESTAGGAIVVGLSTLKTVKSFDEFDFLLAHEMGHIAYDHFTEEERKKRNTKILAFGILIAALATRRSDADTREAVAWSSVGLIIANSLIGRAWDRDQEFEADKLGYELLLESGMSAEGASTLFERLKQRELSRQAHLDAMCGPDSAWDSFLKDLITGFLGIRIPPKGYDPNNPVCAERRSIFAAILRDHPEVEDRIEEVDEHAKKFYADVRPRALTKIGDGKVTLLQFLSPDGDANRLVRTYEGINAFHNGDLATARLIAREVSTRGKAEVLVPILELNFYVANADGRRAEALKFLDQAMRAPQASAHIFDLAESEYGKDGRWGDVADLLELRMRRLGDREIVFPRLITALRLAGQTARMEKALADCIALDKSSIAALCEAAAHPPPVTPTDAPPPAKP